jgi:bacillithiol system protein YtxJ
MRALTTREELDAVLRAPEAVLLKHGAHCPISRAARGELQTFADRRPDAAVYGIEVTEHRDLSDYAAERLGVVHASPQLFVLRDGQAVSRTEHFDISARGVEEALAG